MGGVKSSPFLCYIIYMKDEYIPCRLCSKLPGPKAGFIYKDSYVFECDCHKKYREQRLYSIRAKRAEIWQNPPNILETYLGNKSRQNKDYFIKYIENFKEYQDKVLYLHGPNGTQKTSIVMWGGMELIKQGYKVQYILMYRLIELLTSNFDKQEESEKVLDVIRKSDLLIIDESFAKDKVLLYKSGYQLSFIDSFLRSRIDVMRKGTVFVSNKKSNEIEIEGFGKSLQDLIMRNTLETDLEFLDNHTANKINDFPSRSLFA